MVGSGVAVSPGPAASTASSMRDAAEGQHAEHDAQLGQQGPDDPIKEYKQRLVKAKRQMLNLKKQVSDFNVAFVLAVVASHYVAATGYCSNLITTAGMICFW